MSILIEVNTATMSVSEAHALAGFLDHLYPGRQAVAPAIPAVAVAAPAPVPTPPLAAAASPQALADPLMNAESARVAQAAPPAPPATTAVPAPPAPGTAQAPAPAAVADAELHYPIKLPNGTEIDAEGLPWDKRIHSESKGVLKSGVWKLRRNMDAAVVQHVKNELRQAMAAPPAVPVATSPAPAPVAPPPPAPSVAPAPAIQVEGGTVGTVTAAPAAAPAVQVEGAAPPAAGGDFSAATFADLMSRVVDLSMAGVTPEVINGLCAQVGLAQPRDANHRPDLIPQLMGLLATLG